MHAETAFPMPFRESSQSECAQCTVLCAVDDMYHSGNGLVCTSCHKHATIRDKLALASGERRVDAMLNGALGLFVGVVALSWAAFVPAGPVPLRPRALLRGLC